MSPIERFAREALGCHCAPEVFQRIEEDLAPLSGLSAPVRRIAIGGRLLIYLIPITEAAMAVAHLDEWLAAGLAERDRCGMNRVRLVLSHDALAAAEGQAIEATCARLSMPDDRVHLHLIPAATVPAALGAPHPSAAMHPIGL
ncbi:hypothetical protein [uncultured Thiodictyon sp.]|uniref:hypothetical protein n=1 Tax=uncultured Thiodictyon sp. TaxID=1846217 RepID=UPI0025D76C3E|nr:hypothetical protein [uncultured Thiodictyon sp.]